MKYLTLMLIVLAMAGCENPVSSSSKIEEETNQESGGDVEMLNINAYITGTDLIVETPVKAQHSISFYRVYDSEHHFNKTISAESYAEVDGIYPAGVDLKELMVGGWYIEIESEGEGGEKGEGAITVEYNPTPFDINYHGSWFVVNEHPDIDYVKYISLDTNTGEAWVFRDDRTPQEWEWLSDFTIVDGELFWSEPLGEDFYTGWITKDEWKTHYKGRSDMGHFKWTLTRWDYSTRH